MVWNGSGTLAGRDLSNLINSLWARAEESSEEILCLASCTAQVLFLSLCKPNMGWTVFPYTQQTACTIALFSGHLDTDITRQSPKSYKKRINRGGKLLFTTSPIHLWIRRTIWVLLFLEPSLYYKRFKIFIYHSILLFSMPCQMKGNTCTFYSWTSYWQHIMN